MMRLTRTRFWLAVTDILFALGFDGLALRALLRARDHLNILVGKHNDMFGDDLKLNLDGNMTSVKVPSRFIKR